MSSVVTLFPYHISYGHEVTLLQLSFDCYMFVAKSENLIGYRAYDSDKLDEELRQDGIAMISTYKRNRGKPRTQDGRWLRRYERCRFVERFFSWVSGYIDSLCDGNITPRLLSVLCSLEP
jgi:hypothetical protein